MKFLHIADLHLGKRVNGFDLLADQRFVLEQVVSLCTEKNVGAVAIAGDIYDTPVPPAEAVLLFDWFLTELAARRIPVLAIAGNHDSAERLDYAAALLARQGVYIAGRFTGQVPVVSLPDEHGTVDFCLLPFVRAATVRHFLPDAPITNYDTAVAAALGTLPPAAPGRRRVLLAHQMVLAGAIPPQCSGSESVAGAAIVGAVESIDAARFSGFAYTALGHIHRAQAVGAENIRYSGAPLCYHLDECGPQNEKSAVLVTLGPDPAAPPELALCPLRPLHAMRHLTGPLAKLTDPATVTDAEDYIWATLTDPTPLLDAMPRLRSAYPNAMKLDYAGAAANETAAAPNAVANKSFGELFDEFYEKINGAPMTGAEKEALAALQKEACIP